MTAIGDPYATLGDSYATRRQPDRRVAREIWAALGDARTVVNVGAGTGSYEPTDRRVVAVEPSPVMIAQRPAGAAPVVRGRAERLPFPDQAFDAALAILTVHHWISPPDGLADGIALLDQEIVTAAIDRLAADLTSGRWHQRHADLLQRTELDLGYRLVVAGS